jgi:hypothetical protein
MDGRIKHGIKEKGRASVARYGIGYGWLSALCGGRLSLCAYSPRTPDSDFLYTFWIDLLQELRGRFAHPVASRPLEHPVTYVNFVFEFKR